MAVATCAITGGSNSQVKDFISLTKMGVMSLVVFSGLTGIILAGGQQNLLLNLIILFAIALGSGGSAAINMWFDADIDAIMSRTKKRPIPAGKIAAADVLALGVILSIVAILLILIAANLLAAVLLTTAILFYVFIYTIWLKRLTPQNIVIGGAAGAFPPMIGYAAISGNVTIESILLFMIIFLWTPPHFWALALFRNDDYRAAKVPMLPVVKGIRTTVINIVVYSVILVLFSLLPLYFMPFLGMIYFVSAILLGAWFLYLAVKLYITPDSKNSMSLFGFSIIYLFALFGALIIDKLF